jgi:Zn-dependent metalloprotease
MIRGQLGSSGASLRGLSAPEAHAHLTTALARIAPAFRLDASDLVVRRLTRDEQGHTHLRYEQMKNGLPVVGHELILHVDDTGTVYAANGSARDGEPVPSRARIAPEAARLAALEATPGSTHADGSPRLVYVRSSTDGRLKLAFEVLVTGEHGGLPLQDHVFVSALEGSIVERFSDAHDALSRAVYSANNTTTVPGTLKISEGGPGTGDPVVDTAYVNLGLFYNCFKANFGLDSYNNLGAQLKATVHYGVNVNNVTWSNGYLVCGDGDGVQVGPLCNDMDIINHEFTHLVTSGTSGLTYTNEPGALNESLSDIFSAYCESWNTTTWFMSADVWKMGEDVYTPGTLGDALRYMNNPTQDGTSKDYYPERYTGTSDNGGVHWNSGIPNLAFKLLSTGGTHPRGKTAINVTGIGIQKAGAIFYKANMDLFTASTTFAQAKTYTEQAAAMLYGSGSAEQTSVSQAWQAVGVGTTAPATPLTNGVAITGISGAAGSQKFYYLDVPAGVPVSFAMSGGTGDVDLYVKFGSQPTTASYDCRPYLSGNNETCNIAAKTTAGRYHVLLNAYSAYSSVSLKGQY